MLRRLLALSFLSRLLLSSGLPAKPSSKPHARCFQHNSEFTVTREAYQWVTSVKSKLLTEVTALLTNLGIRYVVAHGNLLEIERLRQGQLQAIAHDDDLDLRIEADGVTALAAYGRTLGEQRGGNSTTRGRPCPIDRNGTDRCARFHMSTAHHQFNTLRATDRPLIIDDRVTSADLMLNVASPGVQIWYAPTRGTHSPPTTLYPRNAQ